MHLLKASILCSCNYIYLVLEEQPVQNLELNSDDSFLLFHICGINVQVGTDSIVYQYIVSNQIHLLRFYILSFDSKEPQNQIIERCILLANNPAGLFARLSVWRNSCPSLSFPYIRNIIKIYQKIAMFKIDSISKIRILNISLSFLEISELATEKQLDYYLIVLNELKGSSMKEEPYLKTLAYIVNFFETKIVPCKTPINWRWLYLFEIISISSNEKKTSLLSCFSQKTNIITLVSFLPASSQVLFKIYVQLIHSTLSNYIPISSPEDISTSVVFDNSTLYLLSKLFSFFSTTDEVPLISSINFLTLSFKELKSYFSGIAFFTQYSQILMKGLLIMTESLYSSLGKDDLTDFSITTFNAVLKNLNLFYHLIISDDSVKGLCENYCKRLLCM